MPAGEEARATFELTPETYGEITLSAKFDSRELKDVDGFRTVRVSAARSPNDINSNTVTAV